MNILIIGCGSIGERYTKYLVKKNNIFLYDEDKKKLKKLVKKYKINKVDSLECVYKLKIDGTIICTPPSSHLPLALKIINYCKNILIEKPISNNLNLKDKFVKLIKKNKSNVYVSCNLRFHPAIKVIKKNLKKLGKIFFVRSHYGNYLPYMRKNIDYTKIYTSKKNLGGGVLLDGVHEIDYLIYLFGKIESVKSSAINKISNLKINTEDYCEIILNQKKNIKTNLHLNYLRQNKLRGCEIVGKKGMIYWQSEGKNPEICNVWIKINNGKVKKIFSNMKINNDKIYNDFLKQFLFSIKTKNNRSSFLDYKQAFYHLKIVEKLKLISKRLKAVNI